jgi:SAM-dependent MidA family methyltransferase
MDLALYCPVCGYYEKEKDIGKHGDFITSVAVGSCFGALLAFQFSEWFQPMISDGEPIRLVEAGAHHGALARDVLSWLREHRAALFERVRYCVIEPSAVRQDRQRKTLCEFAGKVSWHPDLKALGLASAHGVRGVLFSNELLDAMPVHRFAWDSRAGTWFEWGVGLRDGGFVWKRLERDVRPEELPEIAAQLREVLPDGFVIESSPAALAWWRAAAGVLRHGRLMTIDYGSPSGMVSPERANGTLRAYSRHAVTLDVLASPGEQDLTAHVDFEAIRKAGEHQGLATEALVPQDKFLITIAASTWERDSGFGEWSPAMRRQFQTLTHPDHFGRAFHVLVQTRADGRV